MGTPPSASIESAATSFLGEASANETLLRTAEFATLLRRAAPPQVAAVDGGQSVLADVGSCGLVAIRAGYTLRDANDEFTDHVPYDTLHEVVRRRADASWQDLVAIYEDARHLSGPNLQGPHWLRSWCEAERSLAEFDAIRRALARLQPGDLLLLDGSLDFEAAGTGVLPALLSATRRRGVQLAAVTKDTSLSLSGAFPFTLEIEEEAARRRLTTAFAVDLTRPLGRGGDFRTFAVRWERHSGVYRVDLALSEDGAPLDVLGEIMNLSNDVCFPGYPYPLARIHHRVAFEAGEAGDLRRRLETIVAERRGSLFSMRLFGRGRDILARGS